MVRQPDPLEPPDLPEPFALPSPSWADLVFEDWARSAVHHAVLVAGIPPDPEVEMFLAVLYKRAEAAQDPGTRQSILNRLRAIEVYLPRRIPLADMASIVASALVTLDAEILRDIQSRLTEGLTRLGRQMRAMQATQDQVERLAPLLPRGARTTREEVTEWAHDRALYRRTRRLITRLTSPTRAPGLTPEAKSLFANLTPTLSQGQAHRLIAQVLRQWHRLPEKTLTDAHIRARLQPRAKRKPSRRD